MAPRVVLVTGVSRYLGGRLAGELAADPSIERVIGVDVVAPAGARMGALGRTEFVRVDIRNPIIAKVIAAAEVDTIVHMNVLSAPLEAGGRATMKEINVIGTMQLLAACQKAASVQRLVMKSSTAAYGSSARDPALFTESMEPRALPRSGFGKDTIEVEAYVRGFGRRRPDVSITTLRFTNFLGPKIDSMLARYFTLPVVPTVLGFDPRLQFCHEDDAIEVLRRSIMQEHPGTFNVGGDGVLLLSQAIRRSGRPSVPVLRPAVSVVADMFRRAGVVDFSPEQMHFLLHGRVVDTTRLREMFGYQLRYTTAETFASFLAGRAVRPVIDAAWVESVGNRVLELVGAGPGGRPVLVEDDGREGSAHSA